jgi:hypothetical protein
MNSFFPSRASRPNAQLSVVLLQMHAVDEQFGVFAKLVQG